RRRPVFLARVDRKSHAVAAPGSDNRPARSCCRAFPCPGADHGIRGELIHLSLFARHLAIIREVGRPHPSGDRTVASWKRLRSHVPIAVRSSPLPAASPTSAAAPAPRRTATTRAASALHQNQTSLVTFA